MAPSPRPRRIALALCAALALPAAKAEGELAEAAWEDDDACPAGASPAACALSLRQLRARGAAPLAAASAAEEAPNKTEAAQEEEPPEELPGGWGEAAEYVEELEQANQTLEARVTHGWGSCAMYGCIGYYYRGHGCQCNSGCQHHGNCCGDYWSRCHHHHHAPAPAPAHGRKLLTLFHQTSHEACNAILKSNFRPGSQGWCGGGIYFATSAQATNSKAIGPDSHKGCILAALVDVGHVMYLSKTCDRGLNGHRVWAKGYNSVSFDPGDGQEYIVYSSSSVLKIWKAP